MYFNEKEDTNIDKEFKRKSNFDFSKYGKTILIGGGILLVLIIIIIVIASSVNKPKYYINLNGGYEINYYQGVEYNDPGYIASDNHGHDLTNNVTITGSVNTSVIGTYPITYKIGNVSIQRLVNIVPKPSDSVYIHLVGETNMNISVGSKYVEPGYHAYSITGEALDDKINISGSVDTSKKGVYIISYSVVDSNGITVVEKRTVNVN